MHADDVRDRETDSCLWVRALVGLARRKCPTSCDESTPLPLPLPLGHANPPAFTPPSPSFSYSSISTYSFVLIFSILSSFLC